MLKLRFKDNKQNAVWLVEPKVSVGRTSNNDLVVDDAGVADKHLEILVDHERLTLVTCSPENIVQVNGERVTEPRQLQINDAITLGFSELVVVDPKTDISVIAQQATMLRPGSSPWALKANHVSLANRVFPLKDSMIVGRSSECDISLSAAHLSRRHAQLQVLDGLLYVKDLGSANGTYINGKKVSETRVRRGDELRFDTLSFGVIGPVDELDKTTVRNRAATPTKSPSPRAGVASSARSRPVAARPGVTQPSSPEIVHAQHSVSAEPVIARRWGRWLLAGATGLILAGLVLGMFYTGHSF